LYYVGSLQLASVGCKSLSYSTLHDSSVSITLPLVYTLQDIQNTLLINDAQHSAIIVTMTSVVRNEHCLVRNSV